MENNNNNIASEQPPFEVPSGGSLDKGASTSYQKKIYNDALLYAKRNKDTQPEQFAKFIVNSTSISYGTNNPFGDLANKYESGTIKDGLKYKNYPNINKPLSKKYNDYLQQQHNQQLEQEVVEQPLQQSTDNNFEQTQQLPDDQMMQEQPMEESYQPQGQSNQMQLPQQQPQSVYERNYSDQQVKGNNPSNQINTINPIRQMALGGYQGKSYEGGGNLNSFDTGGLHSQNPLGGIPQGTGSNGKLNTVEQGETSHTIDGKKFIFSNRIFL